MKNRPSTHDKKRTMFF